MTVMRTILALLVSTMLLLPGVAADRAQVKNWQVYFSPHRGCTEAVVEALGKARSTVLVQAYSFTSAPIAKALVEAHRRGVRVAVVLDRSQRTEKYLVGHVRLQQRHPVLHQRPARHRPQ